MKTNLVTGIRQLLPATLLFGLMPLSIELLRPHLSPVTIIFGRYSLSALVLLAYLVYSYHYKGRGTLRLYSKKDTALSVLSGALLFFYAFAYINSQASYGVALTLIWTYTFLILTTSIADGIKWMKLRNKIKLSATVRNISPIFLLFFALVFSTMGTTFPAYSMEQIMISMQKGITMAFESSTFPLIAIASGVFFGLRIVFINMILARKDLDDKPIYEGKESAVLMYEQGTTATLTLFSIATMLFMIRGDSLLVLHSNIDREISALWVIVLGFVVLGVISTAFANLFLFKGIKAVESSSITKTITSVEIVFGLLFLTIVSSMTGLIPAQRISVYQLFGALLIISAITIKAGMLQGAGEWIKSIRERIRNDSELHEVKGESTFIIINASDLKSSELKNLMRMIEGIPHIRKRT